jgi:pre-mRNA-splicing factor 38B
MKLFIMRITVPQMQTLLDHTDSPYIRAVGFLYLRYTCPPKEMWKWLEPYIDDEEEVCTTSTT